jgi:hypothetical protein
MADEKDNVTPNHTPAIGGHRPVDAGGAVPSAEPAAQPPAEEIVEPVAEPVSEAPVDPVMQADDPSPSAEVTEKPEVQPAVEPAAEEPEQDDSAAVLAESRKYTRRSFAVAAVAVAAGYGLHRWIESGNDMGQPVVLRRTLQANAAISRAVFDERALAPTYPLRRAEELRVNGVYGLKQALVPESWRLQLVGARGAMLHPRFTPDVTAWEYRYSDVATSESQGHDTKVAPGSEPSGKKPAAARGVEEAGESRSTLSPGTSGLLLTMDDILKLPRHELVTQFKCIEGWSQIVHWAGVRMADFLEAYPPESIDGREPKYVYMETPNGDYYTGYTMDICRHPQTLLVTEMMGAPLTQFHGAPLRLHMPTKYGYKQIKRIGLIQYTGAWPDDYWTKLGYDWYAGL